MDPTYGSAVDPIDWQLVSKSEFQMYGLQQNHIEYLCIAAEIVAALLLIALFIPTKRQAQIDAGAGQEVDSNHDSGDVNCEIARDALLKIVCLRSLVLERGDADVLDEKYQELDRSLLKIARWEDRITSLGNQAFADSFLCEWFSLPEEHLRGSWISVLAIESYSELLHQKGALEFELSLRSVGAKLKENLSDGSLAFRVAPDKFMIAQFGRSREQAIAGMKTLRDAFKLRDTGISLTEGETASTSSASELPFNLVSSTASVHEFAISHAAQDSISESTDQESNSTYLGSNLGLHLLDTIDEAIQKAIDRAILDCICQGDSVLDLADSEAIALANPVEIESQSVNAENVAIVSSGEDETAIERLADGEMTDGTIERTPLSSVSQPEVQPSLANRSSSETRLENIVANIESLQKSDMLTPLSEDLPADNQAVSIGDEATDEQRLVTQLQELELPNLLEKSLNEQPKGGISVSAFAPAAEAENLVSEMLKRKEQAPSLPAEKPAE